MNKKILILIIIAIIIIGLVVYFWLNGDIEEWTSIPLSPEESIPQPPAFPE